MYETSTTSQYPRTQIIIFEIMDYSHRPVTKTKLWNGEVCISSTSWVQLLLHLTYWWVHQEIMKESLTFHIIFKYVHRKAWETWFFYIHWFANKLTRYWAKLHPCVALVLLYWELILPLFSRVSCEYFCSAVSF